MFDKTGSLFTKFDDKQVLDAFIQLNPHPSYYGRLENGEIVDIKCSDLLIQLISNLNIDKSLFAERLASANPDNKGQRIDSVLKNSISTFYFDVPNQHSQTVGFVETIRKVHIDEKYTYFIAVVQQKYAPEKIIEHFDYKFKEIVEQSPISIVITNVNGDIEYVNAFFTEITGYSLCEALGKNPRVLKTDYHGNLFYQNLWQTILSGKTWQGTFLNKKKNGDHYWEKAIIRPLYNKHKEITHIVAIKEDISKLVETSKELESSKEQAITANNTKSAFLANMSHEMRTPLNSIIGFANIMYGNETKQPTRNYLKSIISSGNILVSLINDILDLSISDEHVEIKNEPFNIVSAFEEVLHVFNFKIREKELKFVQYIQADAVKLVSLDKRKLRQILLNLIGNAIKFTEFGNIGLHYKSVIKEDSKADLYITVSDSGVGIPLHYQKEIRDLFNSKGKLQYPAGKGLGLALIKRYTDLLGGTISFESIPGSGTSFNIVLSGVDILSETKSEMVSKSTTIDDYDFSKCNILIVDDNEMNREILKIYIEKSNANILEAINGKEAIKILQKQKIDLAFIDLKMPIMGGYDLVKFIKSDENLRHLPVIAMSASILNEESIKAMKAGFTGFLKKPFVDKMIYRYLINHLKSDLKTQVIGKKEDAIGSTEKLKNGMNILQNVFLARSEDVRKSGDFRKIEAFGNDLRMLAKEYEIHVLVSYADDLLFHVSSFDVERIDQMLNSYKDIMNDLKQVLKNE